MIFFLDIDGVMVHVNPHRSVEQATDGFYVAKWKKKFLDRDIRIDSLQLLDNAEQHLIDHYTRKDEVLGHIGRQCMQSEEMIIIDDDKSLNDLPRELKTRLVSTSSYIGLTEKDLPKLKTILNR
ncbi:HAD domain-containing protein [Sphingobacterium sp. Ag1]|uniref:HAD domain-containing protein n=1 Tax=Sphingobacterium sp. Ag1 TaxID=1643451 RepID=UPI00069AB1A0|nr:HAD domain-containing protein [Sphingobacterium sp. Ag1]